MWGTTFSNFDAHIFCELANHHSGVHLHILFFFFLNGTNLSKLEVGTFLEYFITQPVINCCIL